MSRLDTLTETDYERVKVWAKQHQIRKTELTDRQIDRALGLDETPTLEEARASCAYHLKASGLVDGDSDDSQAAITHALGTTDIPPEDLTIDQLQEVGRAAFAVTQGRLVLRYTEQGRPFLIHHNTHRAEQEWHRLTRQVATAHHEQGRTVEVVAAIDADGTLRSRVRVGDENIQPPTEKDD